RFGGLLAVEGLDLTMAEGEMLGLIGPNGAGKTTVFNLLSGFLAPDAGEIRFRERRLGGLKPHDICRLGLARTFQIVRPFARLSVLDHVKVAALARHPALADALAAARAVRAPWPPSVGASTPISETSMSILLRIDGIQVGYGDMTAVHEASLEVRQGETVALIGGNGTGKTTTLRAVSGLLPLRRGHIELDGRRLERLGTADMGRL